MAASESAAAQETYQEILNLSVELTWFLLGAIGFTAPTRDILETIMAWAEAGYTSKPYDSAATRTVSTIQPAPAEPVSSPRPISAEPVSNLQPTPAESAREIIRKYLAGERAVVASDAAAALAVAMEAGKVAMTASSRDPALPAAHAAMRRAHNARISASARNSQLDSASAVVETGATPASDVSWPVSPVVEMGAIPASHVPHRRMLVIPDLGVPEVVSDRADTRTAISDQRIVGPATSGVRDATGWDDSAIGGSMSAF